MSKNWTKMAVGIIVLLIAITLFLGACGSKQTTPAQTAVSTQTTTPTQAAAQPIKLVFSEFEPPGSYWQTAIAEPYFAEIEKRTNGRVKFEAHYGGELVGLFDVYDAIVKGTVDVAKILPTMFADKFPVDGIGLFNPINIKTYRPGQAWLEVYNQFPEAQAQYKETPLLGYAFMPCSGLATVKGKIITKWEDAKGLKAPGAGPAPESRQKAVGIVPVSIAPPDAYMAFKTGGLDVIAVSLMTLKDFKWGDVLPNVALVNMNGSPWSYVMSAKAWNSLPPDIQQVFKDMVPWLTELNDKVQYQNEQIALRDFGKEFGTNFVTISQAELDRWAAVDSPTLDAYVKEFVTAKGMPGEKIKSEFLRLYEKYGGAEYVFK